MKWWERWAFNTFHGVVAVTGSVYFVMKYLMATDDPFAVVNHPWEPAMLKVHILAAPVFVALFGMLFRSHVYRKVRTNRRPMRTSGWVSIIGFGVMALSGYVVSVAAASDAAGLFIWIHITSSVTFAVGYTIHIVLGLDSPLRRRRQRLKKAAARA